jgi:tRNA1Val (adenine37-N6)-methyltransferase
MLQEKKIVTKPFIFKQFTIEQDRCAMQVGTDGVLLGAWADTENALKMLDIGTGTGIIAIMLAQKAVNRKGVEVHAVEIDEMAFFQAHKNMANAPFAKRLTAFHDSIQDYAKKADDQYDLIVSNPPFFTGGTFSTNQDKNNVRHTVKLPHGDLLHATRQLLSKTGKFCVILPLIEGMRFVEYSHTYGFHLTKKTEVHTLAIKPVGRLLLQFELEPKPLMVDKLIIQKSDERNDYTEDYKDLTKAFYTIF